MVLAEQLLARVLGDLAELVVGVVDDAADVRDRDNRRLVEGVAEILERLQVRIDRRQGILSFLLPISKALRHPESRPGRAVPGRSIRRGSARPPGARGSPSSSRPRRSRAGTAPPAGAVSARRAERRPRRPSRARLMSAMSASDRIHGAIPQRERPGLNQLDPRPELLLGPLVARLARPIDVEQRAPHVMVADLQRADPLVRHVAVGACDARTGVDALVPHLELRMLRLQHLRTGLGVRPVVVRDSRRSRRGSRRPSAPWSTDTSSRFSGPLK